MERAAHPTGRPVSIYLPYVEEHDGVHGSREMDSYAGPLTCEFGKATREPGTPYRRYDVLACIMVASGRLLIETRRA